MTDFQRPGGRLADSQKLQHVEHAVAQILAETDRPVEVYAAVLEAIGGSLGWAFGAVWEVGPDDERLRCVRSWHAGGGAPAFEALSERIALDPGEGLPGRVLVSGEPAWIVDAPEDANFPRAAAARRSGLHAAFGFPLHSPRGVVGVMEFSRTSCASRTSGCSGRCARSGAKSASSSPDATPRTRSAPVSRASARCSSRRWTRS